MNQITAPVYAVDRHFIHCCYMTGQQCVYYRNLLSCPSMGAFVLCPFTPAYNHLFDIFWSALDLQKIGIGGKVRRADTVPRTGYVMCSRICYPIQQSAMIMADVTEENLNVFYKLGLACALEKRVLLLAHEDKTPDHIRVFLKDSGLIDHTHFYPSAGDPISQDALQKSKRSTLFSQGAGIPVSSHPRVLVFSNDHEKHLGLATPHRNREAMICDIIGTVLKDLRRSEVSERVAERIRTLLHERGDGQREQVLTSSSIKDRVNSLAEGLKCFHEMRLKHSAAQEIATADLVVMDTSLKDIETYFWFGACHGLQKDVVPLSATDSRVTKIEHPFDIRTLWHVYGALDLHKIKDQLSQILTELVAAGISDALVKHRSAFWDPLVKSPNVSFYMGTEQARHLESRQVMGEWDVRTFQELSSFATLRSPTLDTVVVKPAFRRESYSPKESNAYGKLLTQRVGRSHCTVVGTPDVNPVAEMALSMLKGVNPFTVLFRDESNCQDDERPPRPQEFPVEGYVPFKNHLYEYSQPRATSFFVQFDSRIPNRGFLYFGKRGEFVGEHSLPYIPREKFIPKKSENFQEWSLFGHLVVAPNPFSESYPKTVHRIILIMGVGGPATYALAHMLTGRPPDCYLRPWTGDMTSRFIEASESILAKVESVFADTGAAEVVIQVTVGNNIASLNNEYEDSRECLGIELAPTIGGVDNPKPFSFCSKGRPSLTKGRKRKSSQQLH